MSSPFAEAVASIPDTLDRILSGEGESSYEICGWHEDDSEVLDLYASAIRHIEAKLGAPNYTGKGGAYSRGNEGSNPGVFVSEYSHSLEITWWRSHEFIFVVLVSGHDANTLLCFSAEYRKLDA